MGSLRNMGMTYVNTDILDECLSTGEVSSLKDLLPLLRELRAYKALGEPGQIAEVMSYEERLLEELATYKAIGSAESIQECFQRSVEHFQVLQMYQELGVVKEVRETFDDVKKCLKATKTSSLKDLLSLFREQSLKEGTKT